MGKRLLDFVTVRGKIYRDNSGVETEIPVILTEQGPLEPLINYLLEKCHARSFSWMQKVVQAVGLLLDYMVANHDCFDDSRELFKTFVQRLYTGTVGEEGLDPSGLYWLPRRTALVQGLVIQLSQFSDWMAQTLGTAQLNPWREATRYEEMLNWAAYHQKHNRAFLAHTWSDTAASHTAKQARDVVLKRNPAIDHDSVKFFPDNRLLDLLFEGFTVPDKQKNPRMEERLNLRDIAITLLMNCGGLRMSESFHLYVHDVLPDLYDSDCALVRVFHPSEGKAPDDWRDAKGKVIPCNRAAYLRGKYGLRPRTNYFQTHWMHSGWKGNLLESKAHFMYVYWFPTWAGRLFKLIWDRYLIQRVLMKCDHPFAFVSANSAPFSIDAFEDAHARAVRRIGLKSAKMLGTTPHAHRHAYGQRLADAKIDPLIRRKALHHKSIESQLVYTEPGIQLVTRHLKEASEALDAGKSLSTPDFLKYGFEDVDALGLLSGPFPKLRRN